MEKGKTRVSVTITNELFELLDKRCKKLGQTKNAYITNLLTSQLEFDSMIRELLPDMEDKLIELVKDMKKE